MQEDQPAPHEDSDLSADGIFLIGARELARKLGRQANRAAIALESRRLRKAEIYLGWLGWQQADFSEEFLRHVEEINRFEREQGDLLNKRADIASMIAALQLQQTENEAESARQLDQIAAERRPLATAHEAAVERLAEKQRELDEEKKKLAQMAGEESRLNRRLDALKKIYPPPEDLREQLLSIQSERSAIDRGKPILQAEIARLLLATKPLRADLKLRESLLSALDRRTKKLRAAQAAASRKLRRQVRSADRQKAAMEKRSRSLERQKKLPFLKLGRVLGDNRVSPMNQPEALQAVLKHRENIQQRREVIAESLAVSRRVDTGKLKKFYLIVAILAAVLAIALILMAEHGRRPHARAQTTRPEQAVSALFPWSHLCCVRSYSLPPAPGRSNCGTEQEPPLRNFRQSFGA